MPNTRLIVWDKMFGLQTWTKPQTSHCVELDPGDVLFFRSEIWHTGSKNVTADRTRYLLQVHYSGRNISQHFSPFLTWQFHPDVLAQANPRQRRLLGDHKQMAYD